MQLHQQQDRNINFCHLYLSFFATVQADTANVSDVTTMENYLWTADINKTNFFKLAEPRDLGAKLASFDLHRSLYGFEARAFELQRGD